MFKEGNDHIYRPDEAEWIGGYCVKGIIEHDYKLGQLHLKVYWNSGDTTWESIKEMR